MKIIKPEYYDTFHCIAGDCSFTCCQEWKIAVDDRTYEKWKKMDPPAGTAEILDHAGCYTCMKDGIRVMALNKSHVCPFLNEEGLCRMVISCGEKNISHTCHIFPREKHDFGDHLEYTLMPSCPEAVDCLNQADSFRLSENRNKDPLHKPNTPAKLLRLRSLLMEILQKEDETAEKGLQAAYFILQSCLQSGRIDEPGIRRDLPELIAALEDLSPDPVENFAECNELFLDLIENYQKEGMYTSDLDDKAALAEALTEKKHVYHEGSFRKIWNSFQPLLRKLLTQEIYADCLIPEGDLESMVIRLQWIAMEYTMIRHLSWLQILKTGELTYEYLRRYIVLASRMMGYEEEDIYEYMENSFEDLVWEWGYFMLITG